MRSITAFALIKKKNPKISACEIYATKEVVLDKGEKMVQVRITHIDEKKKK
jgi:hypothetical protein